MITIQEFKDYFYRNFRFKDIEKPIFDEDYEFITNSDIEKAISESEANFNYNLAPEDVSKTAYLYLAAHNLCMALKEAGQGINALAKFMLTGRSVGSVSESYGVPLSYTNVPEFSYYMGSSFGVKYLSIMIPYTRGQIQVARGATTP